MQHVKKNPKKRFAFFSANHEHLSRVQKDLKASEIICVHWEGFARKCPRYPKKDDRDDWKEDEKLVHDVYITFSNGAKLLCATCKIKDCEYKKQFERRDKIVLAPLEFLFRNDIIERFDEFWIDESVHKTTRCNWDFNEFSCGVYLHDLKNKDDSERSNKLSIFDEYLQAFDNVHRELIRQTSVLFTRPPEELFNFLENTGLYKGKEWVNKGFLRYKSNYVTHIAKIDLLQLHDSKVKDSLDFLLNKEKQVRFIIDITHLLRKILKSGFPEEINYFISNFADFESYFQFLDVLCHYDLCNGSIIVNENIEVLRGWKPNDPVIVEQTDTYERGFARETPYFWDKRKNRYLTTKMGKEFNIEKKRFVTIPNSHFTVGLPYMMQVFKIAYGKPVVLIDATFNQTIFDNHLYRFANSMALGDSSLGLKENYFQIPKLQNKNTLVYKVIPPGRRNVNYSKQTLESGGFERIEDQLKKLIPFLKGNGYTFAGIMHQKYEKIFNPIGKKLKKHYFSQRGMNLFEDSDYMLILGTPYVPPYQILFSHVLNFGQMPKDAAPIWDKGFQGYKDELLQQLLQVRVYDEQYQAAHRCRPLLNNRKIIFYGRVPEKLKDEFTYEEGTFEELFAQIQGFKEYYQEHDDEVRKLIAKWPHLNTFDIAVKELQQKWDIPTCDVQKIISNALAPVKDKIIHLLNRSRYRSIHITKLHKNCDYPRVLVQLGIELLLNENIILVQGRGYNQQVVKLKSDFTEK